MRLSKNPSNLQSDVDQEYNHPPRRYQRRSSKRKIIIYLCLALALETLTLISTVIVSGSHQKENYELKRLNDLQLAELESLRPELAKLRTELDSLIQSRLPHLTKLEFDQIIPINQDNVKNINFTLAGTAEKKQYEYKLTLENRSLSAIFPQIDIVLFNRAGIQVGIAQIGIDEHGTRTSVAVDKGETRSYTSIIPLNQNHTEPEYFIVRNHD
ncbi:MAG: hypothetical protein WC782_10695 [Methylococcaceae bacterium]|jgi:hypothetical protein